MTVVNTQVWQPDAGEDPVGARGYLRWKPTMAHSAPDGTTIPNPFTVPLVNGFASVDVAATGTGWVWSVTFRLLGIKHYTRYYLVPSTGTFDIEDLVEVDPNTLDPAAAPDPGWYAYLDAIAAGQVGVVHVATGNEARLPFGTVLWVGGTSQPVNMADGSDIWFKSAA